MPEVTLQGSQETINALAARYLTDLRNDMDDMRSMQRELLELVKGNGRPGLISRLERAEMRLDDVDRGHQRWAKLGLAVVGPLIAALVGGVVTGHIALILH